MIALLDSGIGGLTVAKALRDLRPTADILYLADSANAPYGTKREGELLPLLVRGTESLLARGAERVVFACITASCLYDRLPKALMPSVIPILPFVAERIAACHGRVGMIATEATVRSDAIARVLSRYGCTRPIERSAAQPLVALAEAGKTSLADEGVKDALEEAILAGRDIAADEVLGKHAPWVEAMKAKYTFTRENISGILQEEVGLIFAKVLEHAGVYARSESGAAAFGRFVEHVNSIG